MHLISKINSTHIIIVKLYGSWNKLKHRTARARFYFITLLGPPLQEAVRQENREDTPILPEWFASNHDLVLPFISAVMLGYPVHASFRELIGTPFLLPPIEKTPEHYKSLAGQFVYSKHFYKLCEIVPWQQFVEIDDIKKLGEGKDLHQSLERGGGAGVLHDLVGSPLQNVCLNLWPIYNPGAIRVNGDSYTVTGTACGPTLEQQDLMWPHPGTPLFDKVNKAVCELNVGDMTVPQALEAIAPSPLERGEIFKLKKEDFAFFENIIAAGKAKQAAEKEAEKDPKEISTELAAANPAELAAAVRDHDKEMDTSKLKDEGVEEAIRTGPAAIRTGPAAFVFVDEGASDTEMD